MTPLDRPDRPFSADSLNAALTQVGGTARPDYLDDLLGQVARTSQRPAWTFRERWIPMTVLTRARSTAPPRRQTWQLLFIAAVATALIAGIVVAGARLLRQPDPINRFESIISVPVLQLADTWDAGTIDGLLHPTGMDVDADGNLYVVNGGTSEILVIDPDGRVVRRIGGTQGSERGEFDFERDPADPKQALGGVAVGPDGSVYVADLINDRVQQLAPDGTFMRDWGGYGPGDGQFLEPIDIAIGPDGSVYVVDDRRDDIQRFSADGTHLVTVGRHGTGDGELASTGGIAIDGAGNLLNADYENHRVQAWGPDDAFLWSRPTTSADHPVSLPGDVVAADHGNALVTDADGLWVVGPALAARAAWTPPQLAVKEDWYPLAAGRDGVVYVAAPFNSTIWKLTIGSEQVDVTQPSATPAPVATAGPTPMAAASDALLVIDDVFPVPFSVRLPPKWSLYETTRGRVSIRATREAGHTPAYFVASIPLNTFADPCHAEGGPLAPPTGPTVDDLVAALTNMPGYRAGPVTDVVIDGHPGKTFELDNNIDITGCSDAPWLRLWTYDASRTDTPSEQPEGDLPGSHLRVAIVDVDGTRVLLWTWGFLETFRDEVAQAYAVFDSIDFR